MAALGFSAFDPALLNSTERHLQPPSSLQSSEYALLDQEAKAAAEEASKQLAELQHEVRSLTGRMCDAQYRCVQCVQWGACDKGPPAWWCGVWPHGCISLDASLAFAWEVCGAASQLHNGSLNSLHSLECGWGACLPSCVSHSDLLTKHTQTRTHTPTVPLPPTRLRHRSNESEALLKECEGELSSVRDMLSSVSQAVENQVRGVEHRPSAAAGGASSQPQRLQFNAVLHLPLVGPWQCCCAEAEAQHPRGLGSAPPPAKHCRSPWCKPGVMTCTSAALALATVLRRERRARPR